MLLLLLLHTSIQNRSSISIHVIPKHTYTLIYHYQHNKFYELFVEMASTFLAPKIIFCSQTSRHGVIIIIIISHTMSMKWTLWKFYVADTIRYDTDMYYSHLNIDICQAIRQFCHLHCIMYIYRSRTNDYHLFISNTVAVAAALSLFYFVSFRIVFNAKS